jgi:hypothetical protein
LTIFHIFIAHTRAAVEAFVDELAGEGKEIPPEALIASTEFPAVLVTA